MYSKFFRTVLCSAGLFLAQQATAQDVLPGYQFTTTVDIEASEVKSQDRTGTCWSYSTASFLESEIIRMGKAKMDLSEMYVVRHVYPAKADKYIRMHGSSNFGEGSLGHDLINAVADYGIVPNEVYSGLQNGSDFHDHSEMSSVLKSMLDSYISQKHLSSQWRHAYNAVLDVYLGKVPESFEYKGKNYTPTSFRDYLGIRTEDYVSISSFTHHPYYKPFIVEVPDNWSNGSFYNVMLDDLVEITKDAIRKGYTIEWDADVSNKGFNSKVGIAIEAENENNITFETIHKEKIVSAEMRQENFDNYTTTDDHLMHITGLAKDQNGTVYFIVKNSWGTNRGQKGYEGYLYVSESYFRMNTISILLHKGGVIKSMAKKLAIK